MKKSLIGIAIATLGLFATHAFAAGVCETKADEKKLARRCPDCTGKLRRP
jgi:hypothetical protein